MSGTSSAALEVLLSYAPLFEGLGREELARLARGVREVQLAKNDLLFGKGDRCGGFHLVVHGQLKLFFTSAQGAEKVVDVLGQDRTYGETLMLAERPYMVSAQALCDTRVIEVPRELVIEEMEAIPSLRLRLVTRMSAYLQELMVDGQSYSLQSGAQRFIGYLLRELPESGAPGPEATVVLPTSKGNISSQLNLTREHFSRILQALSARGLIVVQGRRILIPDLARLANYRD
jgi:CRP-like cAMP-binding protein